MKKHVFNFIKYALLTGAGILLLLAFFPRSYNVPQLEQRKDVLFWNLPTGSRIGYTMVPAKGVKKAHPVIFLQGGPGGFISSRMIEILSPLSEDGYDVYLYDQIGSGHSDRLVNITEYTADRHERDLEEIVKAIGAEKVILIGQSWGAILGTLFIASYPDKVAKAIFTGPGPIQPAREGLSDIKPPDSLLLKAPVYSNADAVRQTRTLRSKCISKWATLFGKKLAADKEADDYLTLLNGRLNKATVCDTSKAGRASGGGGFYAQLMTVKSLSSLQDPRPKLKDASLPVLVMKGQCDNQKWGVTNEYLQLFTNHQLVIIPDAGHVIAVEQPALYLKAIRDFLKEK